MRQMHINLSAGREYSSNDNGNEKSDNKNKRKIMNYHPFVIPFCTGTVFLFSVIILLFIKWVRSLSKNQKKAVRRNIISLRTLKAIWEAIRECLLHRNIFKTNPVLGYMHFSLAFGWFLLIVVGKIETVYYSRTFWDEPWLAIFFRYFENPSVVFAGKYFFNFVMDFLLAFILSGLLLAFTKRFYSGIVGMKRTTKHSLIDKMTLVSLWCIFPFRLLAESVSAGIKHNGGFLTQWIGNALSFLPLENLELPLWWIYSFALCFFFIGMPFTRYMHIFTEILLIFLRKWGVTEEKIKTAYTDIELYACSRCGMCIDVCPLNTELNVKNIQSVYFIRDARYKHLKNETADNCLMCDRCVSACPVGIKSTKIREIFRKKENFEDKKYYSFIGGSPAETTPDVIYFAGCMSKLTPNTIESMKKIFKTAGESYWFMDEEKSLCCGRPLLQQGYQKQAADLQQKNAELIRQSKAKTLVTSCAICYQSFVKEYSLDIEILHHTQYISRLMRQGKLQLEKSEMNVVYHDPCELGRGCGIYDEPRQILEAVANVLITKNERKDSLCCGYNLGNTALELDRQMKIRNTALENLTGNNPDIIITACPMCKRAFSHATKHKVEDIAELVAEKLNIFGA